MEKVAIVDVVDVGHGRQVLAMRLCGALIAVVFLGGIAGLAAASPARTPTPAQQLARIRQFVTAARTAHFTGTSTWTSGNTKPDVGTHTEDKSRADGVLSLPDRSHWTEEFGDNATETIVGPEGVFERDADTAAGLAGEQWKQYPHDSHDAVITPPSGPVGSMGSAGGPGIHAMVSDASDVVGALGAPAEFSQIFTHTTNLTRVNARVIRGTLDLASLPDVPTDAGPLPTVTIEIASGADGRLERLLADINGTTPDESYTGHAEMRFTRWGAPVDVSVPSADSVDKTPDVDEQSLSAFSAAPILVPGNLPAGYALTSGSTSRPGDNGDCAEADLAYRDPKLPPDSDEASAAEIDVTITPASCDNSPAEGDPITVAGHPAHIKRGDPSSNDAYTITVDVVIGETRMTVESGRAEADVLGALRTIVPFDLAKQHIATTSPGSVTS